MAKKVTGFLKLQVPAGAANPSPPIGRPWVSAASTSWSFCKAFNAQTQKIEKNTPIPVIITTYQDRSFTFEMKTPPVSYFLKKAAKLDSGSKTPGREMVGEVTKKQLREIAEQKMKDLNCDTIEAAMKMIEGSARSMGLTVRSKRSWHSENVQRPLVPGIDRGQILLDRGSGQAGEGTR